MPVIEVEILRNAFEKAVTLAIGSERAVPFPTLSALGEHRLITKFQWTGMVTFAALFPGYVMPPGTLLMQSSVDVSHVSVVELKLNPAEQGISLSAVGWIKVEFTGGKIRVFLIGFDQGNGPVVLTRPEELGAVDVPSMTAAKVVATALVVSDSVVVIRLATSFSDNLFQPPTNRLPAIISQPGAGDSDWLMHLPSEAFVSIVLERLQKAFEDLPGGTIIEEAPTASWTLQGAKQGAVKAKGWIKKIDACPGIFERVDLSVEIIVTVEFVWNDQGLIEMQLTLEANASDWDAFRCWLGSPFAVLNLLTLIFSPYQLILTSFATLVIVSEIVRGDVEEQAGSQKIGGFEKVSSSGNSVTYKGTIDVEPLPFTLPNSMDAEFGIDGFYLRGKFNVKFQLLTTPSHQTTFNPDEGQLMGSWNPRINCSLRQMDYNFQYQSIIVSDNVVVSGQVLRRVPVVVYLTSYVEPQGKCWINGWNSRPDLPVDIKTSGMHVGEEGFIVLHTSAGLRTYRLGAIPELPDQVPGQDNLIFKFCNAFHIPSLLIDVQELKWVEPPPNYNWGHEALRQWQIVLRGLPRNSSIEVFENTIDGKLLASKNDFLFSDSAAVAELVTDLRTDLFLRVSHPTEGATISLWTRWLLPQQCIAFETPLIAISKSASELLLHTHEGEKTFDLKNWTINDNSRAVQQLARQKLQSVSVKDSVALIYEGQLIIASPVNTILLSDVSS